MGKAKKVLSFVLALAMAFTVMAGAVNSVSFTDQEQFRTEAGMDAMQILTSLGVIHGFPDGTFKPQQSVTRAELAKMIYIIKTGDAEDGPFYGEADMSKIFTDVYKGHWASKYINFCYLNGIIAGYGDKTFRPEQPVSITEAAKMVLVALGYDADVEGLEGKGYDMNTLRLAQKTGLLKNLTGTMQSASDRENAVIMLSNGLFADTVMYVGGVAVPRTTTLSSEDTITLAEEGFDLLDATAILVANDDLGIGVYHHDAVSSNDTPHKRYEKTAEGTSSFLFKNYTTNATGAYERAVFNVAYDSEFEMLGREYRLLVTKPTGSARSLTIYGKPIETARNDVTVTGSINVEKEEYLEKLYAYKKLDFSTVDYTMFLNGVAVSYDVIYNGFEKSNNAKVTLISNDGNPETIEYVFATSQIIGEVIDVREDGMTIAGDGMGTLESHELRFDGEIPVKGDYVVASKNEASEVWTVKKLIKITGQVTGYNSTEETYRIGGYDYRKSDIMPSDDSALMGSGVGAIAGPVLTFWTDVDGDTRFIIRAAMNEDTSYAQYGLFLWSDVDNKPYQFHTIKLMTQDNIIEYRQVATVNGLKATAADINTLTEGDVFGYVIDEDGFIHVTTALGISEGASLIYDRVTDTFSDVNAGYAPYKHVNGTIFVTYGQPTDGDQEQFKWKAFSGGTFDTALANTNEAKVAANVLTSVTPNVEMPDRIKWSIIGGVRNIEVASLSFDDYAKFGYLLPGLTVNKETEMVVTVLDTAMTYENGRYAYTITYAGANSTETHTVETIGFVAPIATIRIGHIYKLALNAEGKATTVDAYTVNSATNNDGIELEAYTVDTIFKNVDGTYQLSVKKLVASEGKPYYDTLNVTVNPEKTDIFFVDGLFTSKPEMWDKNELPVAGTAINNEHFRVWIDFNASNHEIHNIWIDSTPTVTYKTTTLRGIVPTSVDFADGKFTYGFEDTSSVATTFSTLIPVKTLVAFGEEDSKFKLTAGQSYDMVVDGGIVVDIVE